MSSGVTSLRSWRYLPALAVGGAVLSAAYYFLSWNRPIAPPVTGWALSSFCSWLPVIAGFRVARDRAVHPAARRFWGRFAAALIVADLGVLSTARDSLTGPDVSALRVSTLTAVIDLAGIALVVWCVAMVPTWRRCRSEWVTFGLDAGTVAVGSSLFLWYLSSLPSGQLTDTTRGVPAVFALGCLGVLVTFKISFANVRGLDRGSLQRLAAGTLLASLVASLCPYLIDRPYPPSSFVGVPAGFCLFVLAARRQQRASRKRPAGTTAAPLSRRASQRLNLLPYVAVALTDGLLLATVRDGRGGMVVAVGAVVLTALVVARQIIASRENDRLLDRLDRTVAELRESEDRLSHQASHDELTGLVNRALFGRQVQAALATGPPQDLAVALVDLDDFKLVNDRLGHLVGDALLLATADRLRGSVRPDDSVARLGGDEFAILLRRTGADDISHRVHRILDGLAEPLSVTGQEHLVRASIGVAVGTAGADPLELLRRADVAMYAAKEQYDGGWMRYDPALDAKAGEQARLRADLRGGLVRGEFRVYYQPIVSLPDGRMLGVEALVRWAHPERGAVAPDDFIPLAERTGLIVPLGRWVLNEVCRQAAEWRDRHGPAAPARVCVNVSPRQLRDPGFVADVVDALDRSGLSPGSLVVEVTESAVVDGGGAIATLQALGALGVLVALDDFGTGHSSLGLLLTCPVDILKVDKSFVDGVTGAGDQAVIVTFLIDVAGGLHLQTVAEGVEDAGQAARLHELGYRQAQGFHFARPLPAAEIDQRISAGATVTA